MYTALAAGASGNPALGIVSSVASSPDKLVRMLDGEYTASSVLKDQGDADRLGLTKQFDGNYATPSGFMRSASTTSSSAVLSAVNSLMLGGA